MTIRKEIVPTQVEISPCCGMRIHDPRKDPALCHARCMGVSGNNLGEPYRPCEVRHYWNCKEYSNRGSSERKDA